MGGWKCPMSRPPSFPTAPVEGEKQFPFPVDEWMAWEKWKILRRRSISSPKWLGVWGGGRWGVVVVREEKGKQVYEDREMSRKPWNHCLELPFGQESLQRKLFHSACVLHPPLHLFLKHSRHINMQVEGSFLSSLIGTKWYLNECLI